MDYRSNRILNILVYREQITLDELAKTFDISERMVRKIIKELNEDLSDQQISLIKIRSDNSVYLSDRSGDEIDRIRHYILNNNFYTYRLTPNERKTIMAMLLLNATGFVTAEELSENLIISRNTAINDLKELKDWFANNDLELKSLVQKGYIVEGDELKIRQGMLKLLELNMNYNRYSTDQIDEVFHYLLLKVLKYDERAEVIMDIVKQEEKEKDIHFSDFSFQSLINELLILTERLANEKKLNIDIGNNIVNSSKYPLSEGILSKIDEAFDIYVPDIEKKYFVRNLRKKSYLQSSTHNVDEMIIPFLIGECIHRIADCMDLNFYLDFDLYDVLVDHMKSVIYRTRNDEYLKNPFTGEVEESYPDIFLVVNRCMKPLEDYIGNPFKKDEIAFLVMYFAAMKEKDRQEKNKNRRVKLMVLGDMGRGTMQLMLARLKALQDIVDVMGTKSVHEAKDITLDEADLILSTVNYSNDTIPYMIVKSPILQDSEMAEIRTMAARILSQRETDEPNADWVSSQRQMDLKKMERSFIAEERVLLDAEAKNWEEAVWISGKLLYDSGLIEKEYIQSMIDNIRKNGSYIVICKGLAIPHGEIEKGAIYEGVSMVRLKEPVEFGNEENDPVHYVAGLSVKNSNNINSIIYNLVRMFTSQLFIERLDQCQTAGEMFSLLKDKI